MSSCPPSWKGWLGGASLENCLLPLYSWKSGHAEVNFQSSVFINYPLTNRGNCEWASCTSLWKPTQFVWGDISLFMAEKVASKIEVGLSWQWIKWVISGTLCLLKKPCEVSHTTIHIQFSFFVFSQDQRIFCYVVTHDMGNESFEKVELTVSSMASNSVAFQYSQLYRGNMGEMIKNPSPGNPWTLTIVSWEQA